MGLRSLFGTIALAVAGIESTPAANLLVNPDFDTDLSSWTLDVVGTGASATVDASFGNPASGSAYLDAPNSGSTVTVSQCVAIAAPQDVDLIANTYTDGSSGTSTNGVQIESFDAPGCTGASLQTQPTTDEAFPSWELRSLLGHALPAGTQSVRVSFFIDSGDSVESVHFDHIVFVAESVFRDDFEP